jgi:hypothetical protein
MHAPSAKHRLIKIGRSNDPFLLFTGRRLNLWQKTSTSPANLLAPLLIVLIAGILVVCILAFLSGKLG